MTAFERYVLIADTGDLRYLANEFALEGNVNKLEIIVDELERRDREDKAKKQKIIKEARVKW